MNNNAGEWAGKTVDAKNNRRQKKNGGNEVRFCLKWINFLYFEVMMLFMYFTFFFAVIYCSEKVDANISAGCTRVNCTTA